MQEEERHRISRELNDQTSQQLAALLMGLSAFKETIPSASELLASSELLERIEILAHGLAGQIHRLAWELRPATLDTFCLEPSLRHYVQQWGKQTGLRAEFVAVDHPGDHRPQPADSSMSIRLPSETEAALYRVVQEALTNVHKHAQARNVSVLLLPKDGRMMAIVEDDSRGFEVELDEEGRPCPMARRLGLLSMRDRLELVGGTLTIESAPGEGTTPVAHVPLQSHSRD